jgi:hypothetical protein
MRDKHISEYLIGTPKLGELSRRRARSTRAFARGFRARSPVAHGGAASARVRDRGLRPIKAECRRWAGQGPQQEQEARW